MTIFQISPPREKGLLWDGTTCRRNLLLCWKASYFLERIPTGDTLALEEPLLQ